MATVARTSTYIGPNAERVVWTPLTTTNADGDPYSGNCDDVRCIQVFGTFGAGGSVQLEGSLQATPTVWHILNDPQGNALVFTSGRIERVEENILHLRPFITAGDGTTSLTVIVTRALAGHR